MNRLSSIDWIVLALALFAIIFAVYAGLYAIAQKVSGP